MIMYFNVDNGKIIPNEKKGKYQLDCGDNEQMYLDTGCPSNLVFENDAIRLKTEAERVSDAVPSKVTALEQAANQYLYDQGYEEAKRPMWLVYLTTGNDAQKAMAGTVLQFCKDVQFENLVTKPGLHKRISDLQEATTWNEFNEVSENYSCFDSLNPNVTLEECEIAQ